MKTFLGEAEHGDRRPDHGPRRAGLSPAVEPGPSAGPAKGPPDQGDHGTSHVGQRVTGVRTRVLGAPVSHPGTREAVADAEPRRTTEDGDPGAPPPSRRRPYASPWLPARRRPGTPPIRVVLVTSTPPPSAPPLQRFSREPGEPSLPRPSTLGHTPLPGLTALPGAAALQALPARPPGPTLQAPRPVGSGGESGAGGRPCIPAAARSRLPRLVRGRRGARAPSPGPPQPAAPALGPGLPSRPDSLRPGPERGLPAWPRPPRPCRPLPCRCPPDGSPGRAAEVAQDPPSAWGSGRRPGRARLVHAGISACPRRTRCVPCRFSAERAQMRKSPR